MRFTFYIELKQKKWLLLDCDSITKNAILLEIDDDFYEKHLSTPEQIQATAENRKLVEIVEGISKDWMRIIEKILIKGKIIRRNATATGPIDELEHWLQTHSMYSIAQELITTETFEHHLKCLQISGSKLVHVNDFLLWILIFAIPIGSFFLICSEMANDCKQIRSGE